MATFVLVPGAWLGGWAFRRVTPRLRAAGHDVHPVTLTGLGDRAHLARPEVDLDTHITDVVRAIETEDLEDVVLVGHSYAGVVVTGVADRIPERIGDLVYLDSGPVPADSRYVDSSSPEAKALIERRVAERGDGWRLPMPSWEELDQVFGASLEGLGAAERALLRSHAADHPFGTYTQPLRLEGADRTRLRSLVILCTFTVAQIEELIAAGHPWGRELSGPQWRLVELPTGHWPQLSRPGDLADLLDRLAAGGPEAIAATPASAAARGR
jgi:pimeloyl-ACP methyl ester carboxylesterase